MQHTEFDWIDSWVTQAKCLNSPTTIYFCNSISSYTKFQIRLKVVTSSKDANGKRKPTNQTVQHSKFDSESCRLRRMTQTATKINQAEQQSKFDSGSWRLRRKTQAAKEINYFAEHAEFDLLLSDSRQMSHSSCDHSFMWFSHCSSDHACHHWHKKSPLSPRSNSKPRISSSSSMPKRSFT